MESERLKTTVLFGTPTRLFARRSLDRRGGGLKKRGGCGHPSVCLGDGVTLRPVAILVAPPAAC